MKVSRVSVDHGFYYITADTSTLDKRSTTRWVMLYSSFWRSFYIRNKSKGCFSLNYDRTAAARQPKDTRFLPS